MEKIGQEVRRKGDRALIEYTSKFDGVVLEREELKVSEGEIEEAYDKIDKSLLSAIQHSIQKVKSFHEKALPLSWFDSKAQESPWDRL